MNQARRYISPISLYCVVSRNGALEEGGPVYLHPEVVFPVEVIAGRSVLDHWQIAGEAGRHKIDAAVFRKDGSGRFLDGVVCVYESTDDEELTRVEALLAVAA